MTFYLKQLRRDRNGVSCARSRMTLLATFPLPVSADTFLMVWLWR